MKTFSKYLLLSAVLLIVSCKEDDPEKINRAISFDGVDDYIDLGNIYDEATLPITFCAWIKVDPAKESQTPVFVSQDNGSLYKGFWVVINPTSLFTGYGDGLGENNPAFRRDKSSPQSGNFGKWIHVTAVIRGATDMDVYIGGVNMAGAYSGTSNSGMDSDFPDAVAKIGNWYSNGITYRFKGLVDEVKIWDRALSATEIQTEMKKKLSGSEADLMGYWNFDEDDGNTVFDKSIFKFNGQLNGGAQRVDATDIPGLE
jgi:hypothetical protein